jgi:hypothetical protein
LDFSRVNFTLIPTPLFPNPMAQNPISQNQTKYQEVYKLFCEDVRKHQADAEACFNFGDRFVCDLLKYLDWDQEDAELVMLPSSTKVLPATKGRKISILESNLAQLERVSFLQGGFWSFGVRLSLLYAKSSPARHREVMFVIPLFIQRHQNAEPEFVLKTSLHGDQIESDRYQDFYDGVVGQIKTILLLGAQARLDRGQESELESKFGILLFGI